MYMDTAPSNGNFLKNLTVDYSLKYIQLKDQQLGIRLLLQRDDNKIRSTSSTSNGEITIYYNHIGPNLQHLGLLETFEHYMDSLRFCIDEYKLLQISNNIFIQNNYSVGTGYCLDHIFKYCSNTKSIHCNPDLSTNESITKN